MTENATRTNADCTDESQSANEELLAKVLDDYLLALEQDSPLDIEELVTRHPQLEQRIRSMAESLAMLHGVTQEIRTGKPHQASTETSKRLGDFEIGQEIGRGGMGVVYEARQLSLQRQVALKVLPFAAVWDQKQIARFRNEAQAAAQLQHPNIVPVYAVGQERGVHFYAMQFIPGQSLDGVLRELCCQNKQEPRSGGDWATVSTVVAANTQHTSVALSTLSKQCPQSGTGYCRAIAKLGIQAAEALHYAHECGVIHRDIKPSNLLIDSQEKLWITDFGLARVQDSPGITMTGDVVGTLRYMSPEQAAGQHALVDQRTDVYALGATLYELLTLQAAFLGEDRFQVLQAIEQREPPAPRSINSAIPADLETIVLESMAKSRDQRYPTAQALADDLKRFLEGKPTVARRPTIVDRGAKWLRRHRRVATAATLILLLATTISTVGAFMLAHEKSQKETALRTAEENLQQARLVVDRFGSHFSRQLEQIPGSGPLRQELLQDTLAYYQNFIAGATGNSELRAELATTTFKAAAIANRLGKRNEAQQFYNSALLLFEAFEASTDDTSIYQQYRATCLNNLGLLRESQGDVQDAHRNYQAAIQLQSNLVDTAQDDLGATQALAEMLVNLSLLERHQGEITEARATIQQAIHLLEDLSRRYPDDPRHVHDLAIALNNRSFIEQETDWLAARDSCQAAIDILQRLTASQLETERVHLEERLVWSSDLALCYNNLGSIRSHLGNHQSACQLYRTAIGVQEKLRRQAPAVVRYRNDLAVSWNNLGQALTQDGDSSESDDAFECSRSILAQLADDYPLEIRFRSALAGVLNNQAMAMEHADRTESALTLYVEAIDHQRFAVERAPLQIQYRNNLSKHYVNYGRALLKVSRPIEAAQAARERRQLWPAHSKRLYRVAQELAQAAEQLSPGDSQQRNQIVNDAIATLEQAMSAEPRAGTLPINVADFQSLRNHPHFETLLNDR